MYRMMESTGHHPILKVFEEMYWMCRCVHYEAAFIYIYYAVNL